MRLIKVSHDFCIYNYLIVYNQIWHKCSDKLSMIANWILILLLHNVSSRFQFDNQRIFIKLFA